MRKSKVSSTSHTPRSATSIKNGIGNSSKRATKKTGLRIPRVSLRSAAGKIVKKTSTLRAMRQRRNSTDKSPKSTNKKNSRINNSKSNKNIRLVNKPNKLHLSSNIDQKKRENVTSVSSSLLSPTSNSPKSLSPKLVDARTNALSQIQELQRSLRQKEEEEAVLKIKTGAKITGDNEDVDEEERQEEKYRPSISNSKNNSPVIVIDDIIIDEDGSGNDGNKNKGITIDNDKNDENDKNDALKKIEHKNNMNNKNDNNDDDVNEDFIRKTILDPELKLSKSISNTPRALITALTSRVKMLEASNNNEAGHNNNNNTPLKKTNLDEAFKSTINNNGDSNDKTAYHNGNNHNTETINFLNSQLNNMRQALENKKKQVDALLIAQENDQSMVVAERNINHDKEIELFNLRATVSELRVELRAAKKEADNIRKVSEKTIDETEKRMRESILKSSESHAILVDRTLKKHEEKHDQLELLKLNYKSEIASLNAELKTAQEIAKDATTTLRRHLDIALTTDEELRETHAEAKTLRGQVRQLNEKLLEAEKGKRQAESEAMIKVAELAALRENAILNREKHIDKMLGSVKLENSSMKKQFTDLQNEKDAIEEREMRLQDHCEAMQEELRSYKRQIAQLKTKNELLHRNYKSTLSENRRLKNALKDAKKMYPGTSNDNNHDVAFLKNMTLTTKMAKVSLNRGLYSNPSKAGDAKLQKIVGQNDVELETAKIVSIMSKQENDFNSFKPAKKLTIKHYNAAQNAAALIKYPKISSKRTGFATKTIQAWRPGGNAKPRKSKSDKTPLSPPQFDKDAYYSSNSTNVSNSNGYHQGMRKPWEPRRTKQMATGINNGVSPKPHTPVVAVSLDDSNDNGGQFAAVDIADINVAWDGGSKDDIEVHDKIINRNKKHHSLGLKEDNVHRSKLDELAQVLETLRSSPINPSNI